MESFFSRYKNPLVLMAVLLIQVVGLATQVKRLENPKTANTEGGGTRLIRIWAVSAITPIERGFVGTSHFFRNTWRNYVDLHDVRKQNRELQEELDRLRVEHARLKEDAEQGRRLQALLGFRERFVAQTVAAQVIGSSGSEQSHLIYIDKGSRAGLKPDMAVITPEGIVGKVKDVFPLSAQVLLINDRDSGAGVILQHSRLQGVLKGTSQGEVYVSDIMTDEKVEAGEPVVTSGGDRIYPKGLPVGTVTSAGPDRESEPFLLIKVKPAASLNRLEEVLVVSKISDEAPAASQNAGLTRAADVLAERLPSVPKVEPKPGVKPAGGNGARPAGTTDVKKPGAAAEPKPANANPLATATSGTGKKPANGLAAATTGNAGMTPTTAGGKKPAGQNAGQKAGSTGDSKKPTSAVSGTAGGRDAAAPKPKKTPVKPAESSAPPATTPDNAGSAGTVEKPPR